MAKTDLTLIAEHNLILRSIKNYERYGLEIEIDGGRVDFLTSKLNYRNMSIPEITCYEIKVSVSDFKSKNGHNLVGDYNYYVVSQEVLDYIKSDRYLNNKFFEEEREACGLILIKNNGIKVLKEAKRDEFCRLTFENRIRVMDRLLIRWTSGSMFKYLKRFGITLRNEEMEENANVPE